MSCNGRCFSVTPLEASSLTYEVKRVPRKSLNPAPLETYAYEAVQPWQTRILCLHSALPRSDERTDSKLRADLKIVNLHTLEGVSVQETGEIIDYEALSYSWDHPELSEVLICNGAARMISVDNAVAFQALRHPSQTIYLWIDAVCINQEDEQEKSEQVAKMLNVFRKARSVRVWLGDIAGVNPSMTLAFACFEKIGMLEGDLRVANASGHSSQCLHRLREIYISLLDFYGKRWLGRTWVRQEIYAARHMVIQYDVYKAAWDDFVRLAQLLKFVRHLLPDQDDSWQRRELLVERLLAEAQVNALVPRSGVKSPRDLLEVLTQSKLFGVTEKKDTLYAVLGMCNVTSFTKRLAEQFKDNRHAILVDYSKPLFEVLRDASLHLIGREREPAVLAGLWNFYRRAPAHSEGLSSWVVDWTSGESTFGDDEQSSVRLSLLDDQKYDDWAGGHRKQDWTPLLNPAENEDSASLGTWPMPLQSNDSVLFVQARVLNYVAHLTDYTCTVNHFLNCNHQNSRFAKRPSGRWCHSTIGPEGFSIHARATPHHGRVFLRLSGCREWIDFNATKHSWRLAMLGASNDGQICLVPSTAKKGDLIVAIAPGVLPMIVRPNQGNSLAGHLYPQLDPYEKIRYGDMFSVWEFVFGCADLFLLAVMVCFNVSLALVAAGTLAGTVLLGVYMPTLSALLFCRALAIRFSLERQYDHASIVADLLGFGGTNWFLLLAWCPFIYAAAATIGTRQIVLKIYLVITLLAILSGVVWLHSRWLGHALVVTRRRKEVLTYLDTVTNTLGRDFEFYGPIFVRARRHHWVLHKWLQPRCIRWLFFRLVMVSMNYGQIGSRRLEKTQFDWFFSEVYTLPGDDAERAWDRPLQELKLH